MKKIIFTLLSLTIFTLASEAYTYGWNAPSNTYGGNMAVIKTAPTANGSAQAYQDMVNASHYRSRYGNVPPRKQRLHGSGKPRVHGSAANRDR